MSEDQLLLPVLDGEISPGRQQMQRVYALNGSLYIASRCFLEREQSYLSRETSGYVMPRERSVDIDSQIDWEWGEFLMKKSLADQNPN